MDATSRILRFQLFNFKKTASVFWTILLILNIIGYVITKFFYSKIQIGIFHNGQLVSITGSNIMPILIFFIIYGIVIYHENFRLALNFGATRRDFYKSVLAMNLIASFTFAVIQAILQVIDKLFVNKMVVNSVISFQLNSNPIVNFLMIILVFMSILLFTASFMNIIGILQYRYGYKFWIGLGILIFGSSIFMGVRIVQLFLRFTDLFLYLLPRLGVFTIPTLAILASTIFYVIGYSLFRKVSC
ncbi:MAG: hypothetical protein WCZ27_05525 [Tissierellaceae bacterium]